MIYARVIAGIAILFTMPHPLSSVETNIEKNDIDLNSLGDIAFSNLCSKTAYPPQMQYLMKLYNKLKDSDEYGDGNHQSIVAYQSELP